MISCKEYVEIKKKEFKEKVLTFSKKPCLCVIQIGNNAASNSYIKGKINDCKEIDIDILHIQIDENEKTEYELIDMLKDINRDNEINGIIIQLPVPDKYDVEKLQQCISPEKDVDGFRRDSCFEPCTPKGVIDWLKYNNYEFSGKTACVIGRSEIVGKPLAKMLTDLNCTVTLCHSKTSELQLLDIVTYSDIVFTCIDKIEYFNRRPFNNEQDIIDIGLGKGQDGKLHGNISKEYLELLKESTYDRILISGIGNTGLLTRLALLENVIKAYELNN